jgi:hypothetical protein
MLPKTYQPFAALGYLEKHDLLAIGQDDARAVDLRVYDGKQKKSRDFPPDLPLLIQY